MQATITVNLTIRDQKFELTKAEAQQLLSQLQQCLGPSGTDILRDWEEKVRRFNGPTYTGPIFYATSDSGPLSKCLAALNQRRTEAK